MSKQFKYILIAGLFGTLALTANASNLGPCSKTVYEKSSYLNTLKILEEYEGAFQLGSCSIEIQVCDFSNKEVEGNGSMAAEMLVIDKDGFQRYIPFFISKEKNKWSKQVMFQSRRAMVYRFNDYNSDPESGKDERWDVEIVKTDDLHELDYIEIGYSSKVERKKKVGKKWIICGTEREILMAKRPLKHK